MGMVAQNIEEILSSTLQKPQYVSQVVKASYALLIGKDARED